MSVGYRNRKKAIRRAKKRLARDDALDPKGHIPDGVFKIMQRHFWRASQ